MEQPTPSRAKAAHSSSGYLIPKERPAHHGSRRRSGSRSGRRLGCLFLTAFFAGAFFSLEPLWPAFHGPFSGPPSPPSSCCFLCWLRGRPSFGAVFFLAGAFFWRACASEQLSSSSVFLQLGCHLKPPIESYTRYYPQARCHYHLHSGPMRQELTAVQCTVSLALPPNPVQHAGVQMDSAFPPQSGGHRIDGDLLEHPRPQALNIPTPTRPPTYTRPSSPFSKRSHRVKLVSARQAVIRCVAVTSSPFSL